MLYTFTSTIAASIQASWQLQAHLQATRGHWCYFLTVQATKPRFTTDPWLCSRGLLTLRVVCTTGHCEEQSASTLTPLPSSFHPRVPPPPLSSFGLCSSTLFVHLMLRLCDGMQTYTDRQRKCFFSLQTNGRSNIHTRTQTHMHA